MKFKRILYKTTARIFPLHSNWTLNILNPEIIRVSNCESRCDERRKEVTREMRYIKEQQVYYKNLSKLYIPRSPQSRGSDLVTQNQS